MNYSNDHLLSLRENMKKKGLTAVLIVTGDPHDSEEPAPYFSSVRRYFCPFTGDNAYVLVTEKDAYLFTDGRFFISAEKELEGSPYRLMKMDTPGYPSLNELLKKDRLFPLGLDCSSVSASFLSSLEKLGKVVDEDFSCLMEERPAFPSSPLWDFTDEKYHDLSRDEKLDAVRKKMAEAGAMAVLITTLDDIAYLTNLRANDIACTPLFYSYLYIDDEAAHLFLSGKVDEALVEGLVVHPYDEIGYFLEEREEVPTLVDPKTCNARLYGLLKDRIDGEIPSRMMKAIKGKKEIENIISIQEEDGVALLKLMDYLDNHDVESLNEWDVSLVLGEFRKQGKRYIEDSFPTIAATGPNAAMMHYGPTEDTHSPLKGQIELLVDSGGQYYGGTTDTTRTFLIGKKDEEYVRDYTLTLKAVIALSSAIFIHGTTGRALDALSREVMWKNGMDYKSGTGHGVGYLSVVHEGPNSFRYKPSPNDCLMLPGMITTIEPGVYKKGKYGIRIENNALCVPYKETDDGIFYRLQTITYVPIDKKALDLDLMTEEEIAWLNAYHEEVYRRLSPLVDDHLRAVLKEKTSPLTR